MKASSIVAKGPTSVFSAIPQTTFPLTERMVAAVRRVTPSEHPFANPQ
jgi:hypothetical protein